MCQRDALAVLGLHPGCSPTEAHEHYRALAKELHPDKCKDPGAEERFKELREAFDSVVADPSLLLGSSSITTKTQGNHIQVSLDVLAEKIYFGQKPEVIVRRMGPCVSCHGTGSFDKSLHPCTFCDGSGSIAGGIMRSMTGSNNCPQCNGSGIHVPEGRKCPKCKGTSLMKFVETVALPIGPGTPDGQLLHIPGKGDAGAYKGKSGDLYVKVRVQAAPGLEYRNGRVTMWVDASPAQFVVGDRIQVKMQEDDLLVHIPPLTGKAEVVYRGTKVLVKLNLVIPLKVDTASRSLYGRILSLEKGIGVSETDPTPKPKRPHVRVPLPPVREGDGSDANGACADSPYEDKRTGRKSRRKRHGKGHGGAVQKPTEKPRKRVNPGRR